MSERDSLITQLETLFVLDANGKIKRENDPDRSFGPLFWFGGRSKATIAAVHTRLSGEIGAEIRALAAGEAPFFEEDVLPLYHERYVSLLVDAGYAPRQSLGLTYELPHNLVGETAAHVVDSESEDGWQLEARLARDGTSPELREAGFHRLEDLWRPWCVALHEGEIASVACAARLGATGAELGLTTVKSLRGRGYGAAATRGWTRMPSLRSRTLFYSVEQTNLSSRRVIERLGLRLLGAYLRLT